MHICTSGSPKRIRSTLAYTATPSSGEPEVQDMHGQSLPADVAARYKARNAAVAALQGRLFDINTTSRS